MGAALRHDWYDPRYEEPRDPEPENVSERFSRDNNFGVRKCRACGARQVKHSNHEGGRVVSYSWYPRAGRCKPIEWLTTAANPRSPATGYDAGQRGWVQHAIYAFASDSVEQHKRTRALCGLLPRHGWGLDLYIEKHCSRCERALARSFEK